MRFDYHHSYYAYDHGGERRLKLTGTNSVLDVIADYMTTYSMLDKPTLYPSPYLVVSNHGYTKHYYARVERVCARIGGGGLGCDSVCIVDDGEVSGRSDDLFVNRVNYINDYVFKFEDCPDLEDINGNSVAPHEPEEENPPGQLWVEVIPKPWEFIEAVADLARESQQSGAGVQEEPEVFFCHSDHLGSASWITDASGKPIQHLQYLPFGEPYVDQRTSGYNERFTFTGKERDEETGYGYFGARYMDHELMTMWLSVDPMADKYPSISPYTYCAWNPVKLVDPDGRDWYRNDETGSVIWNKVSDNSIILNGDTYRNIGETYSYYCMGTRIEYGNSPEPIDFKEADPNINIEGGQYIPKQFTTDDGTKVSVSFNTGADNSIDTKTVSCLIQSVNEANNKGANISSLRISSTSNHSSNKDNSAHSHQNGARAMDICMINGETVSTTNNSAKFLQNAIMNTSGWLENYGPFMAKKMHNGRSIEAPWARNCCNDGHYSHIHLSTPKRNN